MQTCELHGQGKKIYKIKTNTSHCPTKTTPKNVTCPLKLWNGCQSPRWLKKKLRLLMIRMGNKLAEKQQYAPLWFNCCTPTPPWLWRRKKKKITYTRSLILRNGAQFMKLTKSNSTLNQWNHVHLECSWISLTAKGKEWKRKTNIYALKWSNKHQSHTWKETLLPLVVTQPSE